MKYILRTIVLLLFWTLCGYWIGYHRGLNTGLRNEEEAISEINKKWEQTVKDIQNYCIQKLQEKQ